MSQSRLIKIAIGLSVLAHVILYHALGLTWLSPRAVGPAGVVSVEFIEPVVHQVVAARTERSDAEKLPKPALARRTKTDPAPAPAPNPSAEVQPESSSTSADASSARAPVPARAGGGAVDPFVVEVGRLINERKLYPRSALTRELEGRVVVAITLAHDGTLLDSVVEEKCPFEALNQAALNAVRGVPKYPARPDLDATTVHLHVPIVFKISR